MNRPILLWILAAHLTLLGTPAAAQNLTKGQEGRLAVGQCYATCIDRAQTTALALFAQVDRMTDLLISDEYHELTTQSQDDLIRLEETNTCLLAQSHVSGMDGCYAGCLDVEQAYGVSRSSARSRFRESMFAERAALQRVGLWINYRETPTAGARFDAACDRYWADTQSSAEAIVSRVGAIPALLGGRDDRTARPVRRSPAPGGDKPGDDAGL